MLLLTLGGTIAMASAPAGGLSIGVDARELLASAGGDLATRVEVEDVHALPSSQLVLGDLIALARLIGERLASGRYAGVVVLQGTDTMEESAFALDLLLDVPAPVVVTGAMRAPGQPGSDALANLIGALATAASGTARGLGTLVVMNDEIHAARFVRKLHTSSPAAFVSVPGPLGWISEHRPRIALRPTGAMRVALPVSTEWRGSVPLVAVGLGDDGTVLAHLRRPPVQGLVVAALGAGHVPAGLVEPLARLAADVPVVLASRTGAGEVPRGAYDFPGSERDLLRRGLVSGRWLDPWRCRVLLELLLRADPGTARSAFADLVDGGIARDCA